MAIDLAIISDASKIPAELCSLLEQRLPATTYLLYNGKTLIGWGQVIKHSAFSELANIEIIAEEQAKGYGKALIKFMLYHQPDRELFLSTIRPDFYLSQGFAYYQGQTFVVDHKHPACQKCQPVNCHRMVFSKPPELQVYSSSGLQKNYFKILQNNPLICEFSVTNNTIWQTPYNPYLLQVEDYIFPLFYPFMENNYSIIPPYRYIPSNIIQQFLKILPGLGIKELRFITGRTATFLKSYPGLSLFADRANYDYLYLVKDLAQMPGRKYSRVKNHLNKFMRTYEYQLLRYTPSDMPSLLPFCHSLCELATCPSVYSYQILENALKNNFLEGYYLMVGEKIVAALFFSELNPKTIVIHFEFSDKNYDGCAQLLNRLVCQDLSKYLFINREQDLGIPGLRQSKLSYRPYRLLAKYTVSL